MKLWTLILMVALGLTTLNADAAKRLGAGKSVGKQSTNVTQREAAQATPGAPGSPTQGAAATAAPSPAAAGAPATPAATVVPSRSAISKATCYWRVNASVSAWPSVCAYSVRKTVAREAMGSKRRQGSVPSS